MTAVRKRSAASPEKSSRKPITGVDVTRHLTYKLVALTNSLSRSAARDFAAAVDLTVPEWRVLATLGSRGEMSLAGLTRVLAVDKGWISRVVARLEARGLVSRSPDPQDDRLFVLALTRAGGDLHLRGSAVSIRRQKQLESALSKDALAALNAALEALQACAERMESNSDGGAAR
ncbi:MAG: MarR family winged helix-turn-helix transcriptional regulator [Burkholderiaceae bacterium]